jgi:5-methylcytosine-specific restriction endonuclease McrA
MKALDKARQTPEFREKHKKAAKEVASRPEWRKKQSEAHRGKKRPPEVGRKISAAKMGHPVSDETRKKLSEANKGENSSFYKDGRSSERQQFYRSWIWRKQRERVLERNNRTCQGCGWTENEVKKLEAHHIDPLRETEHSWNNYPDDLVASLCETCHPPTDSQGERMKGPLNGRGDSAKPERLNNPKYRQLKLDDLL